MRSRGPGTAARERTSDDVDGNGRVDRTDVARRDAFLPWDRHRPAEGASRPIIGAVTALAGPRRCAASLLPGRADRLRTMETVIYYFTGTGNSLAVARGLCERLGDCRCVPIASLRGEPAPVRPAAERVGIVYPVYFFGIPSVVGEVAGRLDLGEARYVFAVCTFGGSGGSPSLRQLDRVLQRGAGRRGLDAGFTVRMPGNYIRLYDRLDDARLARTLADAGQRVAAIAGAVARGERTMPRFSPAGSLIHRVAHPRFIARVHEADRDFTVDDRCTACGTCAVVCPVGNILLEEGRPSWRHRCEQCMACIQCCPAEAIQAGPRTRGRRRYRHPGVTVGALARRDRG